ncbi:hypothetical protein HRW07_22920, partial [Streptomyces lunaelactis]|uniref:transglutaminase family protein n=1 Tax=Streptomyces lunaelactis TaxID=1535768 RepID=UPI001D7E6A14
MHDESPSPGAPGDRLRQFAEEARAERPDLALLCLLVGAVADPSVREEDLDAAQIELDRLAGLLPFGLVGPRAWAAALAELLGARCDFRGSHGDYQRLESSLLHEVLRRRPRPAGPRHRGPVPGLGAHRLNLSQRRHRGRRSTGTILAP